MTITEKILAKHSKKKEIRNLTKDKIYKTDPFPNFIQEIIKSGGLINYARVK